MPKLRKKQGNIKIKKKEFKIFFVQVDKAKLNYF